MDETSARIATICECIDHCFSFQIWCEDFARQIDPEDMMSGLDRGHELVSDATRLLSFVAVRKIDEFLRQTRSKQDDMIASDVAIDLGTIIGAGGGRFLTQSERSDINKGVAHLTQRLTLDSDSEVDLLAITTRSLPIFVSLLRELRAKDGSGDAKKWLDRTDALIAQFTSP